MLGRIRAQVHDPCAAYWRFPQMRAARSAVSSTNSVACAAPHTSASRGIEQLFPTIAVHAAWPGVAIIQHALGVGTLVSFPDFAHLETAESLLCWPILVSDTA